MIDEDVAYMSESSVYRILKSAGLMGERVKGRRRHYQRPKGIWADLADERWQIDIMYIGIQGQNYYLLIFVDEYSRYIVWWRLLHFMDRWTITESAREALENTEVIRQPVIQSDNGSSFISAEFRKMLSSKEIEFVTINVGLPAENALVERSIRTIREGIEEKEPESYGQTLKIIQKVVDYYNHQRYHSALNYLPPIVYYRGEPEVVLKERQDKLYRAREQRRLANLGVIGLGANRDKEGPALAYSNPQKVQFG